MYFGSVPLYDAVYGFKDYQGETDSLVALLDKEHPEARSLLDVACGTGKHVELLRRRYEVEGLDINPGFLEIASARCPGVTFHEADMTRFDLGKKFDIVTCLFSAIAFVKTPENLKLAVRSMASHLRPGGLLIIERYFSPESFWTGTITANFVDEAELKIAWMYTSEREGTLATLDTHYLVGTPAKVDHIHEIYELGLFTSSDYADTFDDNGLDIRLVEGITGRGLYLGRLGGQDGPR